MVKYIRIFFLPFIFLLQVYIYSQQQLTVEDIYTNPEFYPDNLKEFQWIDNGNEYTYLKNV